MVSGVSPQTLFLLIACALSSDPLFYCAYKPEMGRNKRQKTATSSGSEGDGDVFTRKLGEDLIREMSDMRKEVADVKKVVDDMRQIVEEKDDRIDDLEQEVMTLRKRIMQLETDRMNRMLIVAGIRWLCLDLIFLLQWTGSLLSRLYVTH